MTREEKRAFLSSIQYFWEERGDIERYADYSPEKLREADPVLADAYERYKIAEQTLTRLVKELV